MNGREAQAYELHEEVAAFSKGTPQLKLRVAVWTKLERDRDFRDEVRVVGFDKYGKCQVHRVRIDR